MPVYELEKAQVLVLDLSYSMFATDIKPNRLSQAKFKAIDLIKQWSEGEKALIAYAGDAFTISPLTRDGNAIINHIPNLSPDIMPVTGSRADLALDKAIELLQNAGYHEGHIVFISDDISAAQSEKMAAQLSDSHWVVSVLAMATPQGAPIKLPDGGLLKNSSGDIVLPKLDAQPLYDIAQANDGLYLTARTDSDDIKQLGSFFDNKQARKESTEQASADNFAIDDGYWLSFLLIPLCLLLFRKGVLFTLILTISLPFTSESVQAAESSIWKNTQQNAYQAYQDEDYQSASELYDSDFEQGSALYKHKQYEQALAKFEQSVQAQPDNADAFYNKGNSHAQLKQLDEAIAAYDRALALNPNLKLAADNKALLEQMKEQQQEQEQQQQGDGQQDENQQDQDSQQDQQQSEDQQNQDAQQDQQQSSDSSSEQDAQQDQQQSDEQQNSDSSNEQDTEQDQQQNEQQKQQAEQQQQQKEADQQAQLDKQQSEGDESQAEQQAAQLSETDQETNEELEQLPNWLKNMPDDPSILLRRKMQVEYQKRAQSQPVKQQPNNGVIW